jgi:hypothetical protein
MLILEFDEYLEMVDDTLAGVVVIYKNRILLVKPKKFKNKKNKWSIPKGHVENNNILQSALDELREETSLKLSLDTLRRSPMDQIIYLKQGIRKDLKFFIVNLKKKELGIKLVNNMILGHKLKGETCEAGFFSKSDAEKLIESTQKIALKYIE